MHASGLRLKCHFLFHTKRKELALRVLKERSDAAADLVQFHRLIVLACDADGSFKFASEIMRAKTVNQAN